MQADLLAFKEMLATYQLENGTLPTTEQGIKALWSKPTVEPIPPRWRKQLDEETLDPWGHPYQYRNPGKHNPDSYDVFSMGEDGLPDTDDDIGNWNRYDVVQQSVTNGILHDPRAHRRSSALPGRTVISIREVVLRYASRSQDAASRCWKCAWCL